MRRILLVVIAVALAVVLLLVAFSFLRPGPPPEGPAVLSFFVDVPALTPPEDTVFLELEGGSFAMNRTGENRWTITRTLDAGDLLLVGGTPVDYDFPSLADFVGTTTFEIGTPDLENRTVEAIRGDYEALLDSLTQPLFVRWGRPMIFYQVALGGPGGTDTSLTAGHLLMQGTAFEAFFQALWNRTWVEGTFTFGYTYAQIPLVVDASTRGKPAEGVLSKYYGVLPSG